MLNYRAGRVRKAEAVPKSGGIHEDGDSSSGEEEEEEEEEEEGPPTQTAKRQRTQPLQQEHGQQSASQRLKRTFPQASSLRSTAGACMCNVLFCHRLLHDHASY